MGALVGVPVVEVLWGGFIGSQQNLLIEIWKECDRPGTMYVLMAMASSHGMSKLVDPPVSMAIC